MQAGQEPQDAAVSASAYVGLNLLSSGFVRTLQVLQQCESHPQKASVGHPKPSVAVPQFRPRPRWSTQSIPRLIFFFLFLFVENAHIGCKQNPCLDMLTESVLVIDLRNG